MTFLRRHSFPIEGGDNIVRACGQRFELLLLRSWLVVYGDDGVSRKATTLVEEPLPLPDKVSARTFTCFMRFHDWMAEYRSAPGITISVYVFDRGLRDWSARHLDALHADKEAKVVHPTAATAELFKALNWQKTLGCCQHDVHNAAKWSLLPVLPHDIDHRKLFKHLFKVVRGLRGAFGLLVDCVDDFANTVEFVPMFRSFQDREDARAPTS